MSTRCSRVERKGCHLAGVEGVGPAEEETTETEEYGEKKEKEGQNIGHQEDKGPPLDW